MIYISDGTDEKNGFNAAHGSIRRYCRLYRGLYRPIQGAGQGNNRQILQKVKLANNSRQKTISFCLYILPTNVLA